MSKADIIKQISALLIDDKKPEALAWATANYPNVKATRTKRAYNSGNSSLGTKAVKGKRSYNRDKIVQTLFRDGFIDRYSGEKLIFPGMLRLLSFEMPDFFTYHPNWKYDASHIVYWELYPTIDHIVPITGGGNDDERNLVTTSMLENLSKSNKFVNDAMPFHQTDGILAWDGLVKDFLVLVNKNDTYRDYKPIMEWKRVVEKVIRDLNVTF